MGEIMTFTRGSDTITIEILDDGSTVKIETDQISQANHTNANNVILAVEQALGGKVTRARKQGVHHVHAHDHVHDHEHEH